MKVILDLVMSSSLYDSSVFHRSQESYIYEWDAHNFAYNIFKGFRIGPFNDLKNRAKDVDLNEEDESFYYVFWATSIAYRYKFCKSDQSTRHKFGILYYLSLIHISEPTRPY